MFYRLPASWSINCRIIVLASVFILCFYLPGSAQDIKDESTLRIWMQARTYEKTAQPDSSIIYYKVLYDRHPEWSGIGFRLASLYFLQRDYQNAMAIYKQLYEVNPEKNVLALFSFGQIAKITGEYRLAERGFEQFLMHFEPDDKLKYLKRIARTSLEGIDSARSSSALSQAKLAENAPQKVEVYRHIYLTDGPRTFQIQHFNPGCESLSECLKTIPEWLNAQSSKFIDIQNDRYYFSIEQMTDNSTRYVICECIKEEGRWITCDILPEIINPPESNNLLPFMVSVDENNGPMLYFVSDREGGKGGFDLWYTIFDHRRGYFKPPKNLGSKINTPLDEWSPFYDTASNTLYFASNGLRGYGGFDIFSTMGEMRSWTDPEHMGPVINSSFDDYFFYPGINHVYFLSNRIGDSHSKVPHQKDKLLTYKLPEMLTAKAEIVLKQQKNDSLFMAFRHKFDTLYYQKDTIPEKLNLYQFVYNKGNKERIFLSKQHVQINQSVRFNLKPGLLYRFTTDTLSTKNFIELRAQQNDEFIQQTLMINQPREITLLKTIQYDLDEAELTKTQQSELDSSVLKVYQKFPEAKLSIRSHTDNTGTEFYNLMLSRKRAKAVYQFLLNSGVKKRNIDFQGVGNKEPLVPNTRVDGSDDPDARAKNRRTEIYLEIQE